MLTSAAATQAEHQQVPQPQQQRQRQQQQQQQQQTRSKKRSSSTLVALLYALQGRKLTVELRSDVMVTGTLAEVDDYMNVYIDNAVWTPVWGPTQVGRQAARAAVLVCACRWWSCATFSSVLSICVC